MIDTVRKTLATLAVLLGAAHLIFGMLAYKQFNLDMIWFLGAGVAMIVTALANFKTDKIWILKIQNALMLGFVLALVRLAPEPQVWLGIVLFAGLFVLSCVKRKV